MKSGLVAIVVCFRMSDSATTARWRAAAADGFQVAHGEPFGIWQAPIFQDPLSGAECHQTFGSTVLAAERWAGGMVIVMMAHLRNRSSLPEREIRKELLIDSHDPFDPPELRWAVRLSPAVAVAA